MDINQIQFLLFAFILALSFSMYLVIPIIREKYMASKRAVCLTVIAPANLNYDINLNREDIYVYEKYEIWRYFLRKKVYSIFS